MKIEVFVQSKKSIRKVNSKEYNSNQTILASDGVKKARTEH